MCYGLSGLIGENGCIDLHGEACSFVRSYLHIHAFEGYHDNAFIYDIRKLCPDKSYYGVFNCCTDYNADTFSYIRSVFTKGLEEFKMSEFASTLARYTLLNKDSDFLSSVADLNVVIDNLLCIDGLSPVIAWLMCDRVCGVVNTGALGGNTIINVNDRKGVVSFVPFEVFRVYNAGSILDGVDIEDFLIGYEKDWKLLAYYCIIRMAGSGKLSGVMAYDIDLTYDNWSVQYKINDVNTVITVTYGGNEIV